MSAPPNPHAAAVLADVQAERGNYTAIGARYGLTKNAVCGLVRRAGLARQVGARGPLKGKRSTDWESRLRETWRSRHA